MKRRPLFLKKKMACILHFFNEYSNAIMAISACLTTAATFLLWNVASKQVELMSAQIELTSMIQKAEARPIIQINYISETLHDFTIRNNLGSTVGKGMAIWTTRLRNIGRGTAYNLKIEQRGVETTEIDMLPAGQTHEDYIPREKIESGEVSSFVKVTYQDIFENEFTAVY